MSTTFEKAHDLVLQAQKDAWRRRNRCELLGLPNKAWAAYQLWWALVLVGDTQWKNHLK